MPKSADRAAEFNRLLVIQGNVTRSMKYGWRPDDEEREEIQQRAARLIELAELIGHEEAPEEYVNERIAAWMRANPLTLTNNHLAEVAEKSRHSGNPDTGITKPVHIQIGEPGKGGYFYGLLADDLRDEPNRILLAVPESVAEHFRQQGRRQIQREAANLFAFETRL